MASHATLSNFLEELEWTQNHPKYLSGRSRALFPTTFLEIAVYVWKVIINVESYPAAIIWSNGASKSMKQYYTASAPLGHGPRKTNEERYSRLQKIRCLQITPLFGLDELHWILVRNVPLLQYVLVLCPSRYRHFYWSPLRTVEPRVRLPSAWVSLPRKGTMLIFLPHDIYGLAKLEESLIPEKLRKAFKSISQSQPHKVEVSQLLLYKILARNRES